MGTCGDCQEWIYSDDMQEWMCRYAIHDARNDPKHPECHFKAQEHVLIKALEDICKHMKMVAPNCPLSTVVVIATKALKSVKDRHLTK